MSDSIGVVRIDGSSAHGINSDGDSSPLDDAYRAIDDLIAVSAVVEGMDSYADEAATYAAMEEETEAEVWAAETIRRACGLTEETTRRSSVTYRGHHFIALAPGEHLDSTSPSGKALCQFVLPVEVVAGV